MPYYDVEQYELHGQTSRVFGDNPADAIHRLLNGEGDQDNNGPDFIETADKYGSPLRELAAHVKLTETEFYDQLCAANVSAEDAHIPGVWLASIRDITLSDDQSD